MVEILAVKNPVTGVFETGADIGNDVSKGVKAGSSVFGKIGRVATIGGRGVPLLGAAINGGSSYFANERAEMAVATGLVPQDALNPIRTTLGGYTATGLGGIFSMAATETVGATAFDAILAQYDVDPVMGRMIRPEFVSDLALGPSLNQQEWATVEEKYAPETMTKTYADIQARHGLPDMVNLGKGRMVSMVDAVRNDTVLEMMEDHYDDLGDEKALNGLSAMRMAAEAEATAHHWMAEFRPEQDPEGARTAPERAAARAAAAPPAPHMASGGDNAFDMPGNGFLDGIMGMASENGAWAIPAALVAIGSVNSLSGGGMGGMMQTMLIGAIAAIGVSVAEKNGYTLPGLKGVFDKSASPQYAMEDLAPTVESRRPEMSQTPAPAAPAMGMG